MSIIIFLSIIAISELMISSYYLGRYISSTNEIFANNEFASWTLGAVSNLFLTFIPFFSLAWIDPPIVYYIIFFLIKEFLVGWFLIMQRNKIKGKIDFKNILIVLFSGIAITFIYNYGIINYTHSTIQETGSKFSTWFKFKKVIEHFLQIPTDIVNKWILSFLVASISFATIATFIREISRGSKKHVPYLSFVATLGILTFMAPNMRLEDTLGYFLLLFMLLTSIRLIVYSRRRYAAQFGITSFVAWTIDSNIFITATAIAFITTIIYTFLKKPRASLFWVQLISPQIIMLLLQLHWLSIGIVIPLFIFAIALYIFILSARQIKFLSKLNDLVIKYRVAIPIIMFLSIFISSVVIMSINIINVDWMDMKTISGISFNNHQKNMTWGIIQIIAWASIIAFMIYKIIKAIKIRKYPYWSEFIMGFSILLTIFIYNPLVERMFDMTDILSSQLTRSNIVVVLPVIILLVQRGIEQITIQQKNIGKLHKHSFNKTQL